MGKEEDREGNREEGIGNREEDTLEDDGRAADGRAADGRSRKGRPRGSGRGGRTTTNLRRASRKSYRNLRELITFLPPTMQEALSTMDLPYEKLQRINKAIGQVTTGIWAAFPLVCSGPGCPYSSRCPLLLEDVPPLGMDCPIEQYNLNISLSRYMDTLDIDPDNKVELDGALNLAMCDIMMMRVRNAMSKRPDGYSDLTPMGVDNSGNVILQRKASVEVQVEERYAKMKEKHLGDLLATRQARAKYGIADKDDSAVYTARVVMDAKDILKRVKPQVLQLPGNVEKQESNGAEGEEDDK